MKDKLNAVVQAHNFSGVVLVVRSGERLLAQGYGMADLENNVPHALHTKFRIGSNQDHSTRQNQDIYCNGGDDIGRAGQTPNRRFAL